MWIYIKVVKGFIPKIQHQDTDIWCIYAGILYREKYMDIPTRDGLKIGKWEFCGRREIEFFV